MKEKKNNKVMTAVNSDQNQAYEYVYLGKRESREVKASSLDIQMSFFQCSGVLSRPKKG